MANRSHDEHAAQRVEGQNRKRRHCRNPQLLSLELDSTPPSCVVQHQTLLPESWLKPSQNLCHLPSSHSGTLPTFLVHLVLAASTSALPPAASMAALADSEKAVACTFSDLLRLPVPST